MFDFFQPAAEIDYVIVKKIVNIVLIFIMRVDLF